MGPTRARAGGQRIRLQLQDRPEPVAGDRLPLVLTTLLAIVSAAVAVVSLLAPSLIGGAAVTRGNLRGTAFVVLVVAVPLLVAAAVRTAHGSARALVLWLGVIAYLLYQAVLFCFMTPFNNLFLLYTAMLGLALAAGLALLRDVELVGFSARVDPRMPVRAVAGVLAVSVLLNAAAWLAQILPTVLSDRPASVLDGSGLQTSATWVQDLAFWVPAAVVVSVRMWRRRPWGSLLAGSLLAFYVVEAVSVASDQWWGSRADAGQPAWASMAMVPAFLALAVVEGSVLAWYLRNLDRQR